MRKGKNLFLALAAGILLLTACNNEDLVEKSFVNGYETVTATLADATSTSRTSIDGLQVVWNENDAISVFTADGNLEGVLTTGSGTNTASFKVEGLGDAEKLAVLYPYSEDAGYKKENDKISLNLSLPAEYTYAENSISGAVMAALYDGQNSEIVFKNAGALLGITVKNIPAGYNEAILKSVGEDAKPLTGDCIITFDVNGTPTIKSSAETEATVGYDIKIKFAASEEATTKTFYFPVPVANYTELVFSISNGTESKDLKKKALNAQRNKRYQTLLDLNAAGDAPKTVNGAAVPAEIVGGETSLIVKITNDADANVVLPLLNENAQPVTLYIEPTDKIVTFTGDISEGVTIVAAEDAKININLPNSEAVTLSSNGSATNYRYVVLNSSQVQNKAAGSDVMTLKIDDNSTVECVIIESGNWTVEGDVKSNVTIDNGTYGLPSSAALEWFADEVNSGNTFEEKTINLTADIDLFKGYMDDGDPITTTPIADKTVFKGTFDGGGHTIKNLYQNGWALGYEWGVYGSLGLFSNLENATVKNLKIDGMEALVEGGDISFIAGSATGTCVFEDITIKNSTIGTYNNGCGGIIGWSGAGNYTFKNIKLESDVVLGGLWGSFDSSIGGIVGQAEPGATYNFENVTINCRIDAYNDVIAAYKYYNYRMCGMIIGRCKETTTIDGRNYPDLSKYNISFTNVEVNFGEWMNYHYCVVEGKTAWRIEPGYGYGGIPADHDHSTCAMHCNLYKPFDVLIGGTQYGVYGYRTLDDPEVKVTYPESYDPNH